MRPILHGHGAAVASDELPFGVQFFQVTADRLLRHLKQTSKIAHAHRFFAIDNGDNLAMPLDD